MLALLARTQDQKIDSTQEQKHFSTAARKYNLSDRAA